MTLFLGIDAGTTSVKAGLYSSGIGPSRSIPVNRHMVHLGNIFHPGPNTTVYQEIYRQYVDLDETLDAFFRK